MGDCFHRLSGAAAQRVHLHHIAAAHVGQQAADRRLLRRQGDIDLAALHEVDVGGVVNKRHHFLGA